MTTDALRSTHRVVVRRMQADLVNEAQLLNDSIGRGERISVAHSHAAVQLVQADTQGPPRIENRAEGALRDER